MLFLKCLDTQDYHSDAIMEIKGIVHPEMIYSPSSPLYFVKHYFEKSLFLFIQSVIEFPRFYKRGKNVEIYWSEER